MSQKKILIILSQAPYHNARSRDALDIGLTCAAFGQTVSILFSGDAVWLLQKEQNPTHLAQKNMEQVCAALPMYDIEPCFVVTEDATSRGIALETHTTAITAIKRNTLPSFIAQYDVVMRF